MARHFARTVRCDCMESTHLRSDFGKNWRTRFLTAILSTVRCICKYKGFCNVFGFRGGVSEEWPRCFIIVRSIDLLDRPGSIGAVITEVEIKWGVGVNVEFRQPRNVM